MSDVLTGRARRVVARSGEEAFAHGHNYIGTEHLALRVLEEGQCVAAGILQRFGLTSERVLNEIKRLRAQGEMPD